MKTVIRYIISEEDKKLLNTPFPDNPCHSCNERCNCTNSCDKSIKFNETVAKYKSSGVYQYALMIRDIRNTNSEINELMERVREIIRDIPTDITQILSDDIYGWPKNLFGEDINNV